MKSKRSERQQRAGQHRDKKPDRQNDPPVMAKEGFDRCQSRISDLVHPAERRAKQAEQCGQKRDAQAKRDDHPEAGNDPEFGHADIAGG